MTDLKNSMGLLYNGEYFVSNAGVVLMTSYVVCIIR